MATFSGISDTTSMAVNMKPGTVPVTAGIRYLSSKISPWW
ncbi:hypothetical protein J2T02_002019 [Chitinophaga terrae (ex Kim and Jung 2007)]|nr:hypothetical protein [Chitinophaga terrae (ex Kim and Jung 2007)]